jgi:hypothetical protein
MVPNRWKRESGDSNGAQTRAVSPYPFNFSVLAEGMRDPVLEKDVKWLIDSDDDYVVYIDQQNYVEWTMNRNDRLPPEAGPILTRAGWLESVDDEGLTETQLEMYKRLIGEGIARLFDRNLVGADAAMNAAQIWISARAAEASRMWLLTGASYALALMAAVCLGLFLVNGFNADALLHGRLVVITGAAFGGLGAWLSILQRSGTENLDLGAGSVVRRIEGASRVFTGMVGGLFVSLLMVAGYLLSAEITKSRPFFLAVCLVAGLSERLVNSLVGNVEASATLKLPTAGTDSASSSVGSATVPAHDAGGAVRPSVPSVNFDPYTPHWGLPVRPPSP